VLEYLDAIGQDFRTDATNADFRFTRNRLRHQLLPLLRSEFNADFDAAILRLSEQAAESQRVIDGIAAELTTDCVQMDWPKTSCENSDDVGAGTALTVADEIRIDCRGLAGQPPLVVREVCRAAWRDARWPLQAMGFDQWQQLATLTASKRDLPQINMPSNVHAFWQAGFLVLHRARPG
jgi:tRNA(Ile)-lysidine synthase